MRIYLGGPINGCTEQEANGWRDEAKEAIEALGYEWLDPMTRDYRGREMEPGIAAKIVEGDKADIDDCDVLLMNCPKPSVGTSMEILYGYWHDKYVIAVVPDDNPSPWLVYHANEVYEGSAVEAIKELL